MGIESKGLVRAAIACSTALNFLSLTSRISSSLTAWLLLFILILFIDINIGIIDSSILKDSI